MRFKVDFAPKNQDSKGVRRFPGRLLISMKAGEELYDPAADQEANGFVFSNAEINRAIDRCTSRSLTACPAKMASFFRVSGSFSGDQGRPPLSRSRLAKNKEPSRVRCALSNCIGTPAEA